METDDEIDRIIDALGDYSQGFPADAVTVASARRDAVVPRVIARLEAVTSGERDRAAEVDALFVAVHLLGEWRERSAYRPLARLLKADPDLVDFMLGDARTETIHRVLASVFDGDPQPIYDVILDPSADDWVRSNTFESLVILVRQGLLPREEAAGFLRACYVDLEPKAKHFVWDGWRAAVGELGLQELSSIARKVFAKGFIEPLLCRIEDFEAQLKQTSDPRRSEGESHQLWTDTIGELSRRFVFEPEPENADLDVAAAHVASEPLFPASDDRESYPLDPYLLDEPAFRPPRVNPHRDVGRNDPCPCGSGKKFKKCCLGKEASA